MNEKVEHKFHDAKVGNLNKCQITNSEEAISPFNISLN